MVNNFEKDMNPPETECLQRRKIVTPKRYVDFLPEPPPSMPPPEPTSSRAFQFFQSPRNVFGLRRKYYSMTLPSHDPDELITLPDLQISHTAPTVEPAVISNSYFPYPNKNSFLLGNWYWGEGVQKSQEGFKDLVKIVGNPDFKPSDVQNTRWTNINMLLGSSEIDETEDGEWTDVDAGWMKTPIKISVPFHSRTPHPGPQAYIGGNLYHRSLIDVIKERISDYHTAQRFHMEPYEFTWTPHANSYQIPVYGEFYSSPAFIDAHRSLQDEPGESGCGLQRVVIALMFWSDATHLTTFGNAKLWPLYLYFGNDSKYLRCKPSSNLCCHVAYFQDVSGFD